MHGRFWVSLFLSATCAAHFSSIAATTDTSPQVEILLDSHPVNDCFGHADNAMELRVVGKSAGPKSHAYFCSARKANVMVRTDAKGRTYVLLDYADRQASRVDDKLKVFYLDRGNLYPSFTTKLSCSGTSPERDRYGLSVDTTDSHGGLVLKLSGTSGVPSASDKSGYDDLDCMRGRIIRLDAEPAKTNSTSSADVDLQVSVSQAAFLNETFPQFGDRGPCGFTEDMMVIGVGQKQGSTEFWTLCSSYGEASARGVADRSGKLYVALDYGEGRGTGLAREPHLGIYRVYPNPDQLAELIRISTAWETGVASEFTYSPELGVRSSGGVVLTLHGKADAKSTCCVPSQTTHTISIDTE